MLLEWTVPWLILFSCNAKSKVSLGVTNTLWTAPWRADGYVQFCFLSLLGNSMKLAYLVLGAMTLLLLGGCDSALSTSRGSLHTFVGCAVREFTFLAKKPGCSGLRITTDACWGRCETWEKPILEPPYIEAHHRVCTYNETKQVTVKLPNCAPGVDPFYTYPVAVRCDCGACSTETTECETT
ncbi:glycoprotein hormone beta-5 [Peromyscus maniculatus bairdii]|uniref:glycoprotein hormone beta-5 n=1 Tax=Peromyscus maniculatus bairdii TaxID=230844 RepID=UPI003FD58E60